MRTLFASIGVSLTIEAITKISGKGAPRIRITDHSRTRKSLPSSSKKDDGIVNPYAHVPPPFIGT